MDSANRFWDNIVRLHGLPLTIILDKDAKFTSLFWTTLFDCFGTKLAMSSAYHPQMNGQSKVMVRTLKDRLRHFINQNQDNWATQLPALEFVYISSVHPITGYTPFKLDLGYRLWQPHYINDTNAMQAQGVKELIEQQATTMAIAQGQFLMAQQTQALNCKGPQPFKEGEKVLFIPSIYTPPSYKPQNQRSWGATGLDCSLLLPRSVLQYTSWSFLDISKLTPSSTWSTWKRTSCLSHRSQEDKAENPSPV